MSGTSSRIDGLMHSLNSNIVDNVNQNDIRKLFLYARSYANKRARQRMVVALVLLYTQAKRLYVRNPGGCRQVTRLEGGLDLL